MMKISLTRFTAGLALVMVFFSGISQAELKTWGHPGYAFSRNLVFSGTDTDKMAIRFTQHGDRSVNAAWLSISVVKGTPPVYRVGIQGDFEGNPDGVFIASTDYLHSGGTGWAKIDIPENPLTDGLVYHLVLQYQSGTINSNNLLNFAFAQDGFTYIPVTMLNDVNLSVAYLIQSFWYQTQTAAAFLLEYADNGQYGVPYDGAWIKNVRTTERVAQRFQVPESINADYLELRISKVGTPPANLEYRITNLTTPATVISGIFTSENQVAESTGSDVVLPISRINLITGEEYRLELYCETCTNSDHYRAHGRGTSDAFSPLVENTFQGVAGYGETSSDGGTTWDPQLDGDMKFLFREDTNKVFQDSFE